jgi:hypothetical protein
MQQKLAKIYQIKVSLNGVKPPIWRRLLISSSTDLAELHDIIQTAMGWTDTHLHMFVAGGRQYGVPDPDYDDGTVPEERVRISALLKKENDSLIYEYDFGDGWEHRVTLEKIIAGAPGEILPRCIAGRRGCPPEDVGGVWGYEAFLRAYTDPAHPEHDDLVEWAGESFDPERFDPVEVNEALAGK